MGALSNAPESTASAQASTAAPPTGSPFELRRFPGEPTDQERLQRWTFPPASAPQSRAGDAAPPPATMFHPLPPAPLTYAPFELPAAPAPAGVKPSPAKSILRRFPDEPDDEERLAALAALPGLTAARIARDRREELAEALDSVPRGESPAATLALLREHGVGGPIAEALSAHR